VKLVNGVSCSHGSRINHSRNNNRIGSFGGNFAKQLIGVRLLVGYSVRFIFDAVHLPSSASPVGQ
jgi:hypothetical protein